MRNRKLTLLEACRLYIHRYTMEHVPLWSQRPIWSDEVCSYVYYAPQYTSDQEWYDRTYFPGEDGWIGQSNECYSTNPSWPLGRWINTPYTRQP